MHLADFDSCVIDSAPRTHLKLTANFIPRGLARTPSAAFDHALLAVTAIFMLDRDALNLRDGFSLDDMRSFVDNLEHAELITELLPPDSDT